MLVSRWKRKNIDWSKRKSDHNNLLDQHRKQNGQFDVLVPVSGGKDGSYVAYNLKHKFDMNPLCVTITPPLELELGKASDNLDLMVWPDITEANIKS